jgi:anti-anti-sigma factor
MQTAVGQNGSVPRQSRRPVAELWSAHRDGLVLRLAGEIDIANSVAVSDRVVAEVRAGVLHLDLSEVSFCGVAGLDALLDGHAVLHGQGGTLRVTCHPIVARAMDVCGLTGLEGLIVTVADPDTRPWRGGADQ